MEQKLDGAEKLDKDQIQSLYEYEPNRKILFIPWIPYVDIYRAGLKRYDSIKYVRKIVKINKKMDKKLSRVEGKAKKQKRIRNKMVKKIDKQKRNIKEGNLFMRMGEPLAVFDTAKENRTVEKIKEYFHSKGYFKANVSYKKEESYRLVTIIYTIERNKPYAIDSIFYNIPDTAIQKLLYDNNTLSKIKKGDNYQQQNLAEERNRINSLLLNSGYYNFKRQYVHFIVDSSLLGNKKVIIGLNVRNPNDLSTHKIYEIDSVIFTTDADVTGLAGERKTEHYANVKYQFYSKRYSKKILNNRVFIHAGDVYRQSSTLETQKQLSNMDMYKFINVNFDTTGGKFTANIFTSRLSRFQTSTELGANVSQGLPGPFLNASVKNRNTFQGLEIMELSGRIGFEGLVGATKTGNPYSSLEYGTNLTLTFPQFMFPLGKKIKYKLGHFNPKTKLALGFNNNRRSEYVRANINTSLAYIWQNYDKRRNYTLNIADISFINSDVTTGYQTFLEELEKNGNNLINSFNPSFVSSSWLAAVYNINDYGNKQSKSSYLRYQIETGGNLYRLLGESIFNDNIEFFIFSKFNIDYRHSAPFDSHVTLAYRAKLDIAVPHGENKTLPYEKFFFSGGSNSIRAWEPRRLGPGSFLPVDSLDNYNNNFEQPGEIVFEMSLELRHRLFGFLYGALFVDAGNVWTLRDDPIRPGGQFKYNDFYKEIAIGAGYGIRFDFSFLLLRLDAAWKIYDPGKQSRYGSLDTRGSFDLPDYQNYKRLVWNLGIGYPF